MFRQQALDKHASPEQLDRLLQVVKPRSWIMLIGIAALLVFVLLWSVLGRIPVTVSGQAILLYPRKVVAFQAPTDGQIISLSVRVGDLVRKNATLGFLNLPDIETRLQTTEGQRRELQAKLRTIERDRDRTQRELSSARTSGQGLQKELDDLRRLSASTIQLDSQNKSLRQSLAESQATVEKLQSENRRLGSRANREWFIIGALVVIVGMLIGLILPRVRWRKKSSWGDL